MPVRKATAKWEGGLKGGNGNFKGESGGASGRYSAGSRFEKDPGSNPEELLAAAEAACFSMALAAGLERAGAQPRSIETEAACSIEKQDAGYRVTSIKLNVRASASGVDEGAFNKIAEETKANCPVSVALKAVPIELEARLTRA